MSMTGKIDRVEVITSVQRRRRWSAEEKARIVQETYAPGMSVSLVARQHGIAPNQVFTWRRLYAEGALPPARWLRSMRYCFRLSRTGCSATTVPRSRMRIRSGSCWTSTTRRVRSGTM